VQATETETLAECIRMKLLFENWREYLKENMDIKSSDEIEFLVRSIHVEEDDFVEGDLIDRIRQYPYYVLKDIELNKIDTAWTDLGKVDDYAEMYDQRGTDPPPVVLDHTLYTIDGSHRVEAAREVGKEKIKAYVGIVE